MSDFLRLRQICLVAPQLEETAAEFGAILGTDICHRDPKVRDFGVENAMFTIGGVFLEIVAPFRAGTAAGRFLERTQGRGGYIALFDCADPAARAAHAKANGIRTAFTFEVPGRYRCFQLHPRDCRAAMIEFDQTTGGEAIEGPYWPAGGDGWQTLSQRSRVLAVTGIIATSPNPADLGRHWSRILERSLKANILAVDNATIGFESSDDGGERLEAVLLDAGNPAAIMAAAEARGKRSGPSSFVVAGMTFRVSRSPV